MVCILPCLILPISFRSSMILAFKIITTEPSLQILERLKHYFQIFSFQNFVLGFIFLLLVGLFAVISGYDQAIYKLLLGVSLIHILNSFILFLRSNVTALGHYTKDSLFSILDKGLLILICGYLLFISESEHFKIEWFVLAQIFSLSITALLLFLFLRPYLESFKVHISKDNMRRMLRQSIPFALVVFLMSIYTRIDAFMLERLLENGRLEVDAYAGGFRILDALNIIAFFVCRAAFAYV